MTPTTALDKKGIRKNMFLISPSKSYVVGTHLKRPGEAFLMNIHNRSKCSYMPEGARWTEFRMFAPVFTYM